MTDVATLFGFGSYFRMGVLYPKDIDLLILHRDSSISSINVVIKIKSLLVEQMPAAHIAMLSHQEERYIGFIERSGAILLGIFQSGRLPEQARNMSQQIFARRS